MNAPKQVNRTSYVYRKILLTYCKILDRNKIVNVCAFRKEHDVIMIAILLIGIVS